jgi:hypothetical protein
MSVFLLQMKRLLGDQMNLWKNRSEVAQLSFIILVILHFSAENFLLAFGVGYYKVGFYRIKILL